MTCLTLGLGQVGFRYVTTVHLDDINMESNHILAKEQIFLRCNIIRQYRN
jgi:hypothetical protein